MKIKVFGADTRAELEDQTNKWLNENHAVPVWFSYTAERNPQKENAIYYSVCILYRTAKD
jgi:hypothetical protein